MSTKKRNKKRQSSQRKKPLKFLDAANQLITHYNNQEFEKVTNMFENIFKKSGINEDKFMTRTLLGEVYVISAYAFAEVGNYFKSLEILEELDLKEIEEIGGKDLLYTTYLTYYQNYMYMNEFEKAIDATEKLILLRPKLSTNYLRRGFSYLNLKKYKEAELDLVYSLKLEGNWETYINIILLYLEIEDYAKANKYINNAIKVFSKSKLEFLLLYLKIGVSAKLENVEEVTASISEAYEKVPLNEPIYRISLMKIEGKDYTQLYDIIYTEVLKLTEDPRHL